MTMTSRCEITSANQIVRKMWSRTIIHVPLASIYDPTGDAIVLYKSMSDHHILIRHYITKNSRRDVRTLPPKCDLYFGSNYGHNFLATPTIYVRGNFVRLSISEFVRRVQTARLLPQPR